MATAHEQLGEFFPLGVIANLLDDFRPPTEPFAPAGDWEQAWSVVTVGLRGSRRTGTVRLRREAKGNAKVVLHLDYTKPVARAVHRETAELACLPDALSTPTRWTFSCETTTTDGKPLPNTRLTRRGIVRQGAIEVSDDESMNMLTRPSTFTVNWCLFEVVQRLPREPFEPLRFTLFDDFDRPKPGMTLSFWKTAEVLLGGKRAQKQEWEQLARGRIRKTFWGRTGDRPVRLHGYSLLGPGTVPWVFWVDDNGRLLFAVAGLEAYILEAGKSV